MTANVPCTRHGLPMLLCLTTGPCAKERRALRAQERHARALEAAGTTDAKRKRQYAAGGRETGLANRKAPADEVLVAAVAALHVRAPHLSWSEVCEKVGKDQTPPISRQTVATRAAAADWRERPK